MCRYGNIRPPNSKQSTRNSTIGDIDLDFDRNIVTNDVNVVEDVVAIKRSVKTIQTNYYERHDELGCGIRELLFELLMTKVFIEKYKSSC